MARAFGFTHIESRFFASEGIVFPNQKRAAKALSAAENLPLKCVRGEYRLHENGCRQIGGTRSAFLLSFPCLSFRLFHLTLCQPLPKLPLPLLAFVVSKDVWQNAPGDGFNLVLWNLGIVDELLFAAQADDSLRFDMKFLRCGCVDSGYFLTAWLLSQKTENADACQVGDLIGVCICFSVLYHIKSQCQ